MKDLTRMKDVGPLLLLVLATLMDISKAGDTEVTSVHPTKASLNGETRITLYGKGFSTDQFTLEGDENKGNQVTLTKDGKTVKCRIHRDGCTATQIMCYTEKGMEEDVAYKVEVKVDGKRVPTANLCAQDEDKCKVQATSSYTPTIRTLTPQSGKPGPDLMLEIYGKIITNRYGSNIPESDNGREEKLIRAYAPGTCELKNGDELYGLTLDSETSYWGTMKCKPTGTFIGNADVSFIIEAPYGRSKPDDSVFRVSGKDIIHNFQYYADITGISPTEGSTNGGTEVTITGSYFEDSEENSGEKSTYLAAEVYVGGKACKNIKVTKNVQLTCTVDEQPSPAPTVFSGGRGVLVEYWDTQSFSNHDDAKGTATAATGTVRFDETMFCGHAVNTKYIRMTGRFVAPHGGQFSFFVFATNGGALYINGAKKATSNNNWRASPKETLTKDGVSQIVVVAEAGSNADACVKVKVLHYNTGFTKSMVGTAVQERQVLHASTTVLKEKMTVEVTGFTSQSPTNHKQKVCIDSQNSHAVRLSLYGVFTVPFSLESASDATAALNSLPFLADGETFTVTTEGTCLDITFNSERGSLPAFGTDSSATITEQTVLTAGVPSNTKASFLYAGVPSPLFTVDLADTAALATTMQGSFDAMLGVQCPAMFSTGAKLVEDFERGTGVFGAAAVKDVVPFCGRYSYKGTKIYPIPNSGKEKDLSLLFNRWLCFATRGFSSTSNPKIIFHYVTPSDVVRKWQRFTFTRIRVENEWDYTCMDVIKELKLKNSKETSEVYSLRYAALDHNMDSGDILIDNIVFSQSSLIGSHTSLTGLRLLPAFPASTSVTMDTIEVTHVTGTQFEVTLAPFNCGVDFTLPTLAGSTVTTGSTTKTSSSATSKLTEGSGTMEVTRTQKASEPLGGVFRVGYDGKTSVDIDITSSAAAMETSIRTSMSTIGNIKVTFTEDSTCANMDINVEFRDQAGDRPLMTIPEKSLTPSSSADIIVNPGTDGYLLYDPIPGDLIFTEHTTPQAVVYINGVPSMCNIGGSPHCNFAWTSSATPSVTGISASTGKSGDTLTITGDKFSTVLADNTVTIGGVSCVVTTPAVTSLVCTVGNGPIGSAYPVNVHVKGKGLATGTETFTYQADVSTATPAESGLGGGLILSVAGYGFSSTSVVKVGASTCETQGTIQPDLITCLIPPHSDLAATTNAAVDVTVTRSGTEFTTKPTFTYKPSLTATITSFTVLDLTVAGGQTITIDGSGFGTTEGTVYLGDNMLEVTSWADTQVVVKTPEPTKPGLNQQLRVVVLTKGTALKNSLVPTMDVPLGITNVFPLAGSMYGGTVVTITGSGYGTIKTAVMVKMGDHACAVDTVSDTQIVCTIADTSKLHTIDNTGTADYGVYFSFSEQAITVQENDRVKWTWTTPEFVNDVSHGIHQTKSLTDTDYMAGGFSNGANTRNGNFEWRFVKKGMSFVWSGYTDTYQIKNYRMSVNVVDKTPSLGEVEVTVKGQKAGHTKGGSDPANTGCSSKVNTDINGCTPDTITPADTSKHNFHFSKCRSPIVRSVDFTNVTDVARSGTSSTEITVRGDGFSTGACANMAKLGGCECTVTAHNATTFICTPKTACTYPIGTFQEFTLDVLQYGTARVAIPMFGDRSIAFVPGITSISPSEGSTSGGTSVTIEGTYLASVNLVKFSGEQAECTGTETRVCTSPNATNGPVEVYVNSFVGMCSIATGSKCEFTYVLAKTPTITKIYPTAATGASTTLTITGTRFGTDASKISVTVGGESCSSVTLTTNNTVCECTVTTIPAGFNKVDFKVINDGMAYTTFRVSGSLTANAPNPSSGSIHGGTRVTIQGSGFGADTTIMDGTEPICTDLTVTLTEVSCIMLPHVAGAVNLTVKTNEESAVVEFEYATTATPTIASIAPATGVSGTDITITGTAFGATTGNADVKVHIGETECAVTAVSDTSVTCTLGDATSGSYNVKAHVKGRGYSNEDITFKYQVTASAINPATGDARGNQLLTVTGTGFTTSVTVTVCNKPCQLVSATSTEYVCLTPPGTAGAACDVIANDGSTSKGGEYTYSAGGTLSVTSVNPERGTTAGGQTITIAGTGFSSPTVTIDGVACAVSGTPTSTEIQCTTGAHSGSKSAPVLVADGGAIAVPATEGASTYRYIDLFSSAGTWGGTALSAGEMVVIPANQVVLMDIANTPIYDMILIKGGQLIFDDTKDVHLNAKRILIMDGGLLQVGTKEKPHTHKAIIEMHGHQRDLELPIYGTKVLAIRGGTLEVHGMEVPVTWTLLDGEVAVDAETIKLKEEVTWKPGDEIVIASTGGHLSQSENEKHTIKSVAADKMTLTLEGKLKAKHHGTNETYTRPTGEDVVVEMSAEVGLLTRNVVLMGNRDPQWEGKIEACPNGFNPGEFATHTCFQGRFGEETGNSQFGLQIMAHSPVRDTQTAQVHMSYVEVTYAGQAFRLGRYPIHFHLNGESSESYVHGCAVHESFNRAINIHGSHNIRITKNVVYNIMGGSLFLEDGIETGNVYESNVVIFTKASSSLLNDDITPAAFWATNPNNTWENNHAAGGTHFGFWFRMHDHPDGPSFDDNICPRRVPMGRFVNNVVHSQGWFGVWVFQDYYPMEGGGCNSNTPEPAVFENFVTWNCEKGFEWVNGGSLHLLGHVHVQNKESGFTGKQMRHTVKRNPTKSALIKDSLFVGRATLPALRENYITEAGMVLPYREGLVLENNKFLNFDINSSVAYRLTEIQGTCSFWCGGYSIPMSKNQFENVTFRVKWRWPHEAILEDEDGSLCFDGTGTPSKVLPLDGSHLPSSCNSGCAISTGLPVASCPFATKFHRFSYNKIKPASLESKNMTITNSHGTSLGYFAKKRLTNPMGWTVVLVDGETYTFDWAEGENKTNVSFTGSFGEFQEGDCLIFQLKAHEEPDVVALGGGAAKNKSDVFTCATSRSTNKNTGDWYYTVDGYVGVVLMGPDPASSSSRRKRAAATTIDFTDDIPVSLDVYKCFFPRCIPPRDPEKEPPFTARPDPNWMWTDPKIWATGSNGVMTTVLTTDVDSSSASTTPNNVDIMIPANNSYVNWVVISGESVKNLKLRTVTLYGGLEIDYNTNVHYNLEIDFLIIVGGHFAVGWPTNPVLPQSSVSITLAGNQNSPYYTELDGYVIGAKAIAVFGGLDLHGDDVGSSWGRLAETVSSGATVVKVTPISAVAKWQTGNKIIITSTSYSPSETEERTITAIDKTTGALTVAALQYRHTASIETINGKIANLGAAVGLLSRNVVVQGQHNAGEIYGGRILVSVTNVDGVIRTGMARVSNVEFKEMGQDGYTEEYDPRFALAYLATGSVREAKPSDVIKCSFHTLHNTAVGAFGIGELSIKDNVVYKPVGNGIRTSSEATTIEQNLVANLLFTGSYNNRNERFNFKWEGGIDGVHATDLVLKNNYVGPSERACYRVRPEDCSVATAKYENNHAVGCIIGVLTLPQDPLPSCAVMRNFVALKNHFYGIYYQGSNSVQFDSNILSDNINGIMTLITGPGALSHECSAKTAQVKNNLIMGTHAQSDCSQETKLSGTHVNLASLAAAPKGPSGEMIGVVFVTFVSAPNGAPEKPFAGIMSYNALCGKTDLSGNTFANFGTHASCKSSYGIATNSKNDDLLHPMYITGSTMVNVVESYAVVFHRPNVGKINPADCVDMDCDGLKKALLQDEDGTFLGFRGAAFPEAEFEWDGDRRRGIGDYRIPKTALTMINGTKIEPSSLAPAGRGIVRNAGCTKVTSTHYGYWKCPNLDYRLLAIESMSSDTETRRVSPVMILSDGYLDLINGPQDHGWCSGYTCQKRISTFHGLVNPGKTVTIYLSSVQPDSLRLMLLNAESTDCNLIIMYYDNPNRIDVHVNNGNNYTVPRNGQMKNGVFTFKRESGVDYRPTCAMPHGTNYIDRIRRLMYVIIKGSDPVRLSKANVVLVSFGLPAMSEDDFFANNVIENIAGILNIPLNKIRVVEIIQLGGSSRRKRSTGSGITAVVEFGDPPADTSEETPTNEETAVASTVMNTCQDGTMSNALGGGTCNSMISEQTTYTPTFPAEMRLHEAVVAQHEGRPLLTQPKLRAYDNEGMLISNLGITETPWQVTATLRSGTGHVNATLTGTRTISYSNGWFNFTDLGISHLGTGYIIDFAISFPATSNLTGETAAFKVDKVPMTAALIAQTTGDIYQNSQFEITLDLQDSTTDQSIPDISWRGHTFSVNCGLLLSMGNSTLTGVLSKQYDGSDGTVRLNGLAFSGYGQIFIRCKTESTPAEFDFYSYHKVRIIGTHQKNIQQDATKIFKVKYDADYDTTLPNEAAKVELHQATMMVVEDKLKGKDVIIKDSTITKGSIIVTFTVVGGTLDVPAASNTLCADIAAGTTVTVGGATLPFAPYMTVDGVDYYASCTKKDDDKKGLHPGYIALIAVLAALVVAAIVAILIWRFKIKPKSRTHGIQQQQGDEVMNERYRGGFYYIDNGRTVFMAGANQKVEDIFYRQKQTNSLRPDSMAPITTLYDNPGYPNMRKTPLPPATDTLYTERTMTPVAPLRPSPN